MKQNFIFRNTYLFLITCLCTTVLASCSKWDDFKKYTGNGAVFYTGKLDSVKISSGKGRVRVRGVLRLDPKIVKCRIFWNDLRDSIEYQLPNVTAGRRGFDQTFSVSEGVKNFVIYTYDVEGNKSVAVNAIGTSYGDAYRRRLTNRLINSLAYASSNTTINWEQMDLSTGVQFTETEYVVAGNTLKVNTPIAQTSSVLTGFDYRSTRFKYRTVFKPDTSSIDTFATAYTTR